MAKQRFDVVVVGARCAGAVLATFLARSGMRALMVDKNPLPSDQVLSTHTIHPPGIDILDELGVGDAVRAVGVQVKHADKTESIGASLVVGADGRHSFVARDVTAQEYMAYDAPRAMYWAYWDAPESWHTDRFPFDMYLAQTGDDIRVIFQTDDGQLLIGSLPSVRVAQSWRHDAAHALCRNLAEDSVIGPLLAGAKPASSVRGTVKERYFFRQGAGPGWVLAGDAGHHKEFVVGDGITESLIQARSLGRAIMDGGDDALLRWWRARDVAALPQYYWGRDEGSLDPPSELETLVVARVARNERLQRLMTRLPEHQCSPYDAVPISVVIPCLLGALFRGRFAVMSEFLAQGRRMAGYKHVLKERIRLLEATRVGTTA